MRLTSNQIQSIRQHVREVAGEHSLVRVFSSRPDDTARGGDIDLLKFRVRVVEKECRHLATTDSRLFKNSFGIEQVPSLEH